MAKRLYSRLEGVLKYGFYFFSFILIITNLVFFVWNWNSLEIRLDASSLFLTFVGFLFAFAGINIYSIFNTNIENEKYGLMMLQKKYDKMLELSAKELLFPKDLMTAHLLSNYISGAKSITINSLDWLDNLVSVLNKMRDFTKDLKSSFKDNAFERCRLELNQSASNIYYCLNSHKQSLNDDFFKKTGNKETYIKRLDEVINLANTLRTYELEDEESAVEPKIGFLGKIKAVYHYSRTVFNSKHQVSK